MAWRERVALIAVVVVVSFAGIAAPSELAAQSEQACRDVSVELEVEGAETAELACQNLAIFLRFQSAAVQSASELIRQPGAGNPAEVFSERDFQQRNPSTASMAGSLAQGGAIAPVSPTALASGSVAMVGSDAGDDALVALGLNPAVLFFIDEASEGLAKYARFMDLSVFVPVTDVSGDGSPDDGGLEYLGARLRFNWLGLRAGNQLWAAADSLITNWLVQSGRDVEKVLELLRDAPDLGACARALAADAPPSVQTADCGRAIDLGVDADEAAALGVELGRIRTSLDSRYFGADVRLDWGDPTLGAVAGASGRFLFAGLGYGRRVFGGPDDQTSVGIRLNAGARHATLDLDGSTSMAFEGGFGLEVTRSMGFQEVSAAFGVEARYGYGDGTGGSDEQFQTDFTVLRTSLVIPITDANSVSIALGVPIDGEMSTYLSANFNWGLLLPGGS